MDGEITRLIAVARARDRLRKAAFRGGYELLPIKITFSADWLREFVSLKDRELFCPVIDREEQHSSFWGVPISVEPLGAQAVVTYSDGSTASVQLEVS